MEADHSAEDHLLCDIEEPVTDKEDKQPDTEGLQPETSHLIPVDSMNPTTNSYHPESDGLQLSENQDSSFRGYRDSEGLQSVIEPLDPAPRYSSIQPDAVHEKKDGGYFVGSQPMDGGQSQGGMLTVPSDKKRRKKWLIIGGVIAAIIIILAAVLGGVLGSRAAQNKDVSASPASSPTSSASASRSRVKSTSGAWNGTDFSLFVGPGNGTLWLVFQDYEANLVGVTLSIDAQSKVLKVGNSSVLKGVNPAAGTGLTNTWYFNDDETAITELQLVYVASDGHLADSFQHVPLYTGDWTNGSLASQRVAAPTDLRNGMAIGEDTYDGPTFEQGGNAARLYAGTSDGHIDGYSYTLEDQVWDTTRADSQGLPGSSEYAGITIQDFYTGDDNAWSPYNRLLFTMDDAGTILGYVQDNGVKDNSTHWPAGNPWNPVITSGQKAAPDSGLVVVSSNTDAKKLSILFPTTDGKMGVLPVTANGTSQIAFQPYSNVLESVNIMPGSSIQAIRGIVSSDDNLMVFYQDEGSSLAWLMLDSDDLSVKLNGRIISQNGQWASSN